MSNLVLAECWRLQIKAAPKLVLIALADQADDDGYCWPSIGSLMARTGMSERAIQGHLADLEEAGAITRRRRRQATTLYRVTASNFTGRTVTYQPKARRADLCEDRGEDATSGGASERAKDETRRFCGVAEAGQDPQISTQDPQIRVVKNAGICTRTIIEPSDRTPIPRERARGGWGEFARLYPKKGKAGEARAIWGHLDPDDQELAIAVLRRQLSTPAWQGAMVQHLPTMARWLAERQFELYPDPRPPQTAAIEFAPPLTAEQRQAGSAAARAARATLTGAGAAS